MVAIRVALRAIGRRSRSPARALPTRFSEEAEGNALPSAARPSWGARVDGHLSLSRSGDPDDLQEAPADRLPDVFFPVC